MSTQPNLVPIKDSRVLPRDAPTNPKADSPQADISVDPSAPVDPSDPSLYVHHDPDLLAKLGGTRYGKRRWTLGNSNALVAGAQKEPLWVSVAWIVVPTGLMLLVLAVLLGR